MAPPGIGPVPSFRMGETDLASAFAPFGSIGHAPMAVHSPVEGGDNLITPIGESPVTVARGYCTSRVTVGHRTKRTSAMSSLTTLCAVCARTYDEPKVLACFHSFCRGCLHVAQPDNVICIDARVTVLAGYCR